MRIEKDNDILFLNKIIGDICDYSVVNGMNPNETLGTIAKSIEQLLEICDFSGWKTGKDFINED